MTPVKVPCEMCGEFYMRKSHNGRWCERCKMKASSKLVKDHRKELEEQVDLVIAGKLSYNKINFKTSLDRDRVKWLMKKRGFI